MSKRRWDGQSDDAERLVVRCKGRRVLAVLEGEPPPVVGRGLGRRESPEYGWLGQVLDGNRVGIGAGDRDWGAPPIPCPWPEHPQGHDIDGRKLREALDWHARPGHVAPVDVRRVERDPTP